MPKTTCLACANCFMEPGDQHVCGHPEAGPIGLYIRHATAPDGHCGPDRKKFVQHPLRNPDGSLKMRDGERPKASPLCECSHVETIHYHDGDSDFPEEYPQKCHTPGCKCPDFKPVRKGMPKPATTEEAYACNPRVQVVVRNRYAFQEHRNLLNIRLEVRIDTGPETCDWITVPGTVTSLMPEREAHQKALDYLRGGWKAALENAARIDHTRHPNVYLDVIGKPWTHVDDAMRAEHGELLDFVKWAADPDCPLPVDLAKGESWGSSIKRHAGELLAKLKGRS